MSNSGQAARISFTAFPSDWSNTIGTPGFLYFQYSDKASTKGVYLSSIGAKGFDLDFAFDFFSVGVAASDSVDVAVVNPSGEGLDSPCEAERFSVPWLLVTGSSLLRHSPVPPLCRVCAGFVPGLSIKGARCMPGLLLPERGHAVPGLSNSQNVYLEVFPLPPPLDDTITPLCSTERSMSLAWRSLISDSLANVETDGNASLVVRSAWSARTNNTSFSSRVRLLPLGHTVSSDT